MAGAFVALALVILVLPQWMREGIARGIRASVLRPVMALQRDAAEREGRYADASVLRAERDSLAAFLVGQSSLAAENRQLRSLLGLRGRMAYTFVAAEAARISDPLTRKGLLLLSVGARDGVRPGDPIVTAEGLVGTVQKVDDASSVGIDWTHPDFRVSAMTTDGETYGIAQPGRHEGEEVLSLSPNAFHTVPKNGSVIVSSGDGQVYPRGIPVGKVIGAGRDGAGWQRTYFIRPLVAPSQTAHVLVLGRPVAARADQDLAAGWGIRLTGAPPTDSIKGVSPDAATPVGPAAPRTAPRPSAPLPRRPAPRVDVVPPPATGTTPGVVGVPTPTPPAPTPPDTTRTRDRR